MCSGRFSIRRSERWQDRKRYHKKTYREREKPLFFTGWTICGTAISGAGRAQLSWYFAEKRDGKKRADNTFLIEIPKESLQKVFDGETLELEVPGGRVRFCGLSPEGKIGEIDKNHIRNG